MSDDTTQTTSETSTVAATPAPENVVPFTPASETTPAAAAPEASSATAPDPQAASTGASATPAAGQAGLPTINNIQDAIAHVVNTVDINTVSHHDVVHDLFQSSQEYAFKLLLSAKLFEQMIIRDSFGLKGEAFDLLRHADEAVTNEIHAILKSKVVIPAPVAPASEVPATEPAASNDQAVS
jgi:hypothetical protein